MFPMCEHGETVRPPHTSRFFVGGQKLLTRRLVCGEFLQVCDKIEARRTSSRNIVSGLVGWYAADQDSLLGLPQVATNQKK